ncbi:NAC domain-containing protein 71-like [Senna tora]|uniref:NAC domain-containing protein 71-like n=1 Tax=Senna tora TaxID=362788 RepID=A0A834SJT9_9FABA|nr:NAC domain-containing protein 71-like [Senna tora]
MCSTTKSRGDATVSYLRSEIEDLEKKRGIIEVEIYDESLPEQSIQPHGVGVGYKALQCSDPCLNPHYSSPSSSSTTFYSLPLSRLLLLQHHFSPQIPDYPQVQDSSLSGYFPQYDLSCSMNKPWQSFELTEISPSSSSYSNLNDFKSENFMDFYRNDQDRVGKAFVFVPISIVKKRRTAEFRHGEEADGVGVEDDNGVIDFL